MLKVVGREAVVDDEADGRSLLDEIAREGARRMLLAALETEVAAYLEAHAAERDGDGHALVVRNGKGRTRNVTVGSGTIAVNAPRVNDRRVDDQGTAMQVYEPHPATLHASLAEGRRGPARALPARPLHRRLPRGARGAARKDLPVSTGYTTPKRAQSLWRARGAVTLPSPTSYARPIRLPALDSADPSGHVGATNYQATISGVHRSVSIQSPYGAPRAVRRTRRRGRMGPGASPPLRAVAPPTRRAGSAGPGSAAWRDKAQS
jgi:hypothetical protein